MKCLAGPFSCVIKVNMKMCWSEQKKGSMGMTFSFSTMQIPAVERQKLPHRLRFWPGIDHSLPITGKSMAQPSLSPTRTFPDQSAPCHTAGIFNLNVS